MENRIKRASPSTLLISVLLLVWGTHCGTAYSMLHNYQGESPHLSVSELAEQDQTSTIQKLEDDLGNHIEFLDEQQFKGTFINEQKDELFGYLTVDSGQIEALLYKDQLSNSKYAIDRFVMILFNPVYHDQRAVRVAIELGKMQSESQWAANNSKGEIDLFWKERQYDEYNTSEMNYSIKIKNIDSEDVSKVTMELMFSGKDFEFSATLHYNDQTLSTMGYCFYISGAVGLQILSIFLLIRKIETTHPNIINKLSLTTVALCNIQDFYLTMMHIQYIMISASNSYLLYVLPALAYILLFVIFDMKLLFLVWRSHYMREIDNPQALRKKLTVFYIKFYVGLFVYLTLTYFFTFDPWMIVVQNLIIIPQIVHSARVGNNPGFEPLYAIGYLGGRFLIPLYQRSCPQNHFQLMPMPGLVICIAILYLFQISIMYLQMKLGPRFFIPRMFQPDYYDYSFKLKNTEENKELQCSICLEHFFDEDSANGGLNASEIKEPMFKEKSVLRTPCNHYFHRQCLIGWVDVKSECPTCRGVLPPL